MKQENRKIREEGRYLARPSRRIRPGRGFAAAVMLLWDGLLLYMIGADLIEPVYGAAFVGVISVWLGYKI